MWDRRFLGVAKTFSEFSKDPSTKVGCVIVGPNREVRSTGYNGLPRGAVDDLPERQERPEKYFWFEHAERNAIYNAARVGVPLEGCTLYSTLCPCMDCARGIIQAGIKRVVSYPYYKDSFQRKWIEDFYRVPKLLQECNVGLEFYDSLL